MFQLVTVLAVGMAVLRGTQTPSEMALWHLALMAMILGVIGLDHFDLAAATRGRVGGLHFAVGFYALMLSVFVAFPAMVLEGVATGLYFETFQDDIYGGPRGTFHHHVVTAVTCLMAMVNRSARDPKVEGSGRRRSLFATASTVVVVLFACLGMGWLATPGVHWLINLLADAQNGILTPVGPEDVRSGFVRDGVLPGGRIYLLTPAFLVVVIALGMQRRRNDFLRGAVMAGTAVAAAIVIYSFYAATLPAHVPIFRGILQFPPLRSLACLTATFGVIAIALVGGRGWGRAEGQSSLLAAKPVNVAVGVGLLMAGVLEILRTSELKSWWTHDDPFPRVLAVAMVGLGCHWLWSVIERKGPASLETGVGDEVQLRVVVGVWVLLILLVLSLAPFGTAVNDLLTAAG